MGLVLIWFDISVPLAAIKKYLLLSNIFIHYNRCYHFPIAAYNMSIQKTQKVSAIKQHFIIKNFNKHL